MTTCNLCGREEVSAQAKIEGTILDVCSGCAQFGEVISIKQVNHAIKPKATETPSEKKNDITIIVPDYAQRIKNAREKRGLKQEEVAKNICERLSVIQKVESGDMRPGVSLAKKLESFFHVTLITVYDEKESISETKSVSAELTIGDLLQQQLKKEPKK